jgi:hypothetical protein
MRRNGPTSTPARTIGTTGAAFGLAALLCIGSPAAFAHASESDAHPAPTSTPTPASTTDAQPTPSATPTAAPVPVEPAPEGAEAKLGGFTDLTANADTFTVVAGHPARFPWSSVLGNDIDPTGQPVLLTSWTKPSKGTIDTSRAGSFFYISTPGHFGDDYMTYDIHDVYGNTNVLPGIITIHILPDTAPVAVRDTYTVPADKPFVAPTGSLLANDTDAELDDLTVVPTAVSGPDHGTVALKTDGGFTYTPDTGYSGYDSFFYRVADGFGGTSGLASVEFTVVAKFATVKPKVTGTTTVGKTLTVTVGTWTPTPTTLKYQWFRDGDPITGATAKTYVPTVADMGWTLRAMVIGSKTGYPTEQVLSSATAPIAAAAFTTVPKPTITGTAKVGSTLTAKAGTWAPVPAKLTYHWKAGGVPIPNADVTKSTFTLTAAQVGKTVSVTVSADKPGYATGSKDSAPTSPVLAKTFTATPAPTIAGTTKVGRTLTAQLAAWTPATTSLSYQWKRNGVAIAGATAPTYKPVAADAGAKLTVSVKGAKTAYTAVTRTSAATSSVAK